MMKKLLGFIPALTIAAMTATAGNVAELQTVGLTAGEIAPTKVALQKSHNPAQIDGKLTRADRDGMRKAQTKRKAAPEGEWTALGDATWYDEFYTNFVEEGSAIPYQVPIEESVTTPGYYRIYPYAVEDNAFNTVFGLGTDPDCVVYINATNPAKVYIDGDFAPFPNAVGWNFSHVVPENYWNGESYATLKDGMILFPAKSVYMSQDASFGEDVYIANSAGEFKILLPGVEFKDTSVSVLSTICADNDKNTFYFTFGADVEAAKIGIVSGFYDNENEDIDAFILAQGQDIPVGTPGINFTAPRPGIYTFILASINADGQVADKAFGYCIANESDEDWAPVKNVEVTYHEGTYAGLFTNIQPEDVAVGLEECISTPGRYRLVNPYSNHSVLAGNVGGHNHGHYIYINATDPEKVYVEPSPTGVTFSQHGNSWMSSMVQMFLSSGYPIDVIYSVLPDIFGTYADGVITIPSSAVTLALANYRGGELMTAEGFTVTIKDVTKRETIRKYFSSSYSGAEFADYFAQQYEAADAETAEETYAGLVSTAIAFMESDMEYGFIFKSNETGSYIAATTPADTEGTVFSAAAAATPAAYWVAEFTEQGAPANPDDEAATTNAARTFYLRNVATGTYLGKPAADGTAIPAVAPEAKETDAAQLSIVAGAEGFEFAIVGTEGTDCPFIAIAAEPGSELQAAAAGTCWSAEKLTEMTQPATVEFLGETAFMQGGEETFVSIEAISIKVPAGALPTEIGTIEVTATDADNNQHVIFKASSSVLATIEPTEGNIKSVTYDENDKPVVTTVPASVYTLALNPARTEPGEYHVTVGKASFELNGEYSTELNAVATIGTVETEGFDIAVTPADGIVETITEITLNSETGMAPNFAYTGENMTLVHINSETVILSLGVNDMETYDTFSFDDMTRPYYTIPVNKADKGTYSLTIPAGFFENDSFRTNNETNVTWTIEETDGINTITSVSVNGHKVYDLQGRRVAAPSKGLYIINGKKIILK